MRLAALTFAAFTALAGAAVATAAVKPESAIHYRQSVYTMIGWNFAPMGEMVKGKTAFDAAEFSKHAERIAFLAPQLLEGFPQGSDTGAKTQTKPGVWTHMDDFKSKMSDLVAQSKTLADVAKGGDEAAMKEQFKKTAGTCKTCHDDYRSKD